MIEALTKTAAFLLEHADLIEELADAIAKGATKDALRLAVRAVKLEVSDRAMKEELGAGAKGP